MSSTAGEVCTRLAGRPGSSDTPTGPTGTSRAEWCSTRTARPLQSADTRSTDSEACILSAGRPWSRTSPTGPTTISRAVSRSRRSQGADTRSMATVAFTRLAARTLSRALPPGREKTWWTASSTGPLPRCQHLGDGCSIVKALFMPTAARRRSRLRRAGAASTSRAALGARAQAAAVGASSSCTCGPSSTAMDGASTTTSVTTVGPTPASDPLHGPSGRSAACSPTSRWCTRISATQGLLLRRSPPTPSGSR